MVSTSGWSQLAPTEAARKTEGARSDLKTMSVTAGDVRLPGMGVLPGKHWEFGVSRCELVKQDGLTAKSTVENGESPIQYLWQTLMGKNTYLCATQ